MVLLTTDIGDDRPENLCVVELVSEQRVDLDPLCDVPAADIGQQVPSALRVEGDITRSTESDDDKVRNCLSCGGYVQIRDHW